MPTRLAKTSRRLNKLRGGNPDWTVCEEEWDRMLNGDRIARYNVILLDFIFRLWKHESQHCRSDWLKRRR